jgi:hypothetical protein
LLPYFTPSQLNTSNETDYFELSSHSSIAEHFDLDCLLCYDSECKNNGRYILYFIHLVLVILKLFILDVRKQMNLMSVNVNLVMKLMTVL